jgi:hypothetical protein
MTVYQQLQLFYLHSKFRFDERAKKRIGARVASLWRSEKNTEKMPPSIESKEESGIYKVLDYPEEFSNTILKAINIEQQDILRWSTNKRQKKASPPLLPSPPVTEITPKKRNRIPVKAKPLWKAQ